MTGKAATPTSEQPDYQAWLAEHYPSPQDLQQMREDVNRLGVQPLISVIMPVYDPPEPFLRAAIDSVRAQAYPTWELCIADDGSTLAYVTTILDEAAEIDARVRIVRHATNRGIVAASNSALELASGDFVAFLDHDDELTPHALYQIAAALSRQPDTDMIYSDEDKIDADGKLSGPVFKPDWCPDSFLSRMYTCHLSAYRRLLVKELGGFREGYDGGQSYDLVLRLTEVTDRIHHIPDVLYHWRFHAASTASDATQKLYVYEADKRALQDAIDRRGEPGRVMRVPGELGFYIVRYRIQAFKRVSIIIPSKDQGDMLDACLDSIFTRSTYPDFEVILVDNETTEPRGIEVIAAWHAREPQRFRSLALNVAFNFSALCNHGVEHATGEFLLFLNNDTEVITSDWIEAMVEQAQRPSIGAVGALLLYEDGTIQHAGAILGLGGLAAHSHRGIPATSPGYMSQVITMNNYLSVAGSCLMIRRSLFDDVGGFDERLPGDYEDVDLCLKLIERGHRNIYLPHVRLYHFESVSRGKDYVERAPADRTHAVNFIRSKWQAYIDHDPCYNPNLTRAAEDYSLNVQAPVPASARWCSPRSCAKRLVRRMVNAFHRVCPGVPEVKGRGTKAACRGIVRRVGSQVSPIRLLLTDDDRYRAWLRREYPTRRHLAAMRRSVAALRYRPLLSVILPVHDIEAGYLRQAIDSVRAQVYPHWELCIADDGSTASHVRPLLERYVRLDSRIKIAFRKRCGNISAASNSALALATGEFVAQLDHDDMLAPHALYEVATLLNARPDTDYIYSDEDKIDAYNVHQDPFFKPDWCPDTFLTKMYTCHLGVYRRTLVGELGGFRSAYDGAEDYDLVLRLVERTSRIAHIPHILYHWRIHPKSTATGSRVVKSWAYSAAVRALQDALDRRGEPATVSKIPGAIGMYDVRYRLRRRERVSIIIPTKDLPRLLDRCLLSIFETSTYTEFEVIVIDNGSVLAETQRVLAKWCEREAWRFRSLRMDVPFNFATLSNSGVDHATGRFLLFLNDDTQVISADWIESMMEQAQRPAIGAVGVQLLYQDNTVQHAGVVIGISGTAGHAHRGAPGGARHYFGRLNTISNVSAVTAACLMCRRETFEEVGRFDETFDIAYNDVDLCLRMLERGLRNIYLPHVALYHLESQSWMRTAPDERCFAHARAAEQFQRRWARYIEHDPCYSPHLSRTEEGFVIG